MYKLPNEAKIAKEIQRDRRAALNLIDQKLRLAEEIVSSQKWSDSKLGVYQYCQLGLLCSGIRALYSVLVLCGHGLDDEAMLPMRTLIEITSNSRLLSQGDKLKDAQRFRDYLAIKKYRLIKNARQYISKQDNSAREVEREWKDLIREVESRVESEKFQKIFNCAETWYGKTIQGTISDAGYKSSFDMPYSVASLVSHGSNISSWFKPPKDIGEGIANFAAKAFWTNDILLTSSTMFCDLLAIVDEALATGRKEHIGKLCNAMKSYWETTFQKK